LGKSGKRDFTTEAQRHRELREREKNGESEDEAKSKKVKCESADYRPGVTAVWRIGGLAFWCENLLFGFPL
jgi:hypothetical protein